MYSRGLLDNEIFSFEKFKRHSITKSEVSYLCTLLRICNHDLQNSPIWVFAISFSYIKTWRHNWTQHKREYLLTFLEWIFSILIQKPLINLDTPSPMVSVSDVSSRLKIWVMYSFLLLLHSPLGGLSSSSLFW